MSRETDTARITDAVEAAELKTSAEFVVAVKPRCGSYRDVDVLFGAVAAFASLLYTLINPWSVHDPHPVWLPLNLALVFGMGWFFSAQTRLIHRWCTGADRRHRQVQEAGRLLFMQQGVSQTRGRTGVLVLISQTEQRIEEVADSGVLQAVEEEEWAALIDSLQSLTATQDYIGAAATAVDRLGDFLADPLPVADDDIDELSNVPRLH